MKWAAMLSSARRTAREATPCHRSRGSAAEARLVWRAPPRSLRVRAQHRLKLKSPCSVPLSGPWARSGVLEQMGARMAVDDVNAAGGIKSLGGAKLTMVEFDAGDTTEKAKDAAQRMLAQEPDLAGGFGGWLSSFVLAITEVTERAELPWLTQGYSDLITGRGFKYVFQSSPTGDAAGRGDLADHHGPGDQGDRHSGRPRSPSSATTPPPRSAF